MRICSKLSKKMLQKVYLIHVYHTKNRTETLEQVKQPTTELQRNTCCNFYYLHLHLLYNREQVYISR